VEDLGKFGRMGGGLFLESGFALAFFIVGSVVLLFTWTRGLGRGSDTPGNRTAPLNSASYKLKRYSGLFTDVSHVRIFFLGGIAYYYVNWMVLFGLVIGKVHLQAERWPFGLLETLVTCLFRHCGGTLLRLIRGR